MTNTNTNTEVTDDDVTVYGADHCGARAVSFTADGLRVLVSPGDESNNSRAVSLAKRLLDGERAIGDAHKRIDDLTASLHSARRKIPPPHPVSIFRDGVVRFDSEGRLWLLDSRTLDAGTRHGWGSFGVAVDGWDDLFRRYAVHVVAHGVDATGAWWRVVNQRGLP